MISNAWKMTMGEFLRLSVNYFFLKKYSKKVLHIFYNKQYKLSTRVVIMRNHEKSNLIRRGGYDKS